jgi:hypothetical protein
MKILAKFVVAMMFFVSGGLLAHEWASVYRTTFSERELADAKDKNAIIFAHHDVPMFTQLLCSWNAVRPTKGHLIFYVQARNAHTKKWGGWHRMLEWGNNMQRSHVTKSDGFTKYMHVRLETELLQLADAFCVKVLAAKGASVDAVKGLAVTVVNMHSFKPESISTELKNLTSVYLKRVPKISQMALEHPESNRICSPVSCTMLMQYLTGKAIDPALFAQRSFDKGLNAYGSWPFNMAHAFEYTKGKNWFYNTRLNSFTQLHKQLMRGLPVVVSVRGQLAGAPKPFPYGHLLLVAGWDKATQEVLCHDPSAEQHGQVFKRYKLADFLASWERSRRLTYWVEPVDQRGNV